MLFVAPCLLPMNSFESPSVSLTPVGVFDITLFEKIFSDGRPSETSGSSDPSYVKNPAEKEQSKRAHTSGTFVCGTREKRVKKNLEPLGNKLCVR